GFQRLGIEAARTVTGAEVAHDHVRFPELEARTAGFAFDLDRRHQRVRVQRAVLGRLHDAETAAGIGALEGEAELPRAPDDLADIDRAEPTPDLQHRVR